MQEWVWWVMEMMRRLLRDWWVPGRGWDAVPLVGGGDRTGYKGDGCVMIVDVAGAGIKNIVCPIWPLHVTHAEGVGPRITSGDADRFAGRVPGDDGRDLRRQRGLDRP